MARIDDLEEFCAATHAQAEAHVGKFSQTIGGLALDLTDEVFAATANRCARWWWSSHNKQST